MSAQFGNGTSDKIQFLPSASHAVLDRATFIFVYELHAYSTYNAYFRKNDGSGSYSHLGYFESSTRDLAFDVHKSSGDTSFAWDTNLSLNVPYFIAVTYDHHASTQLRCYVGTKSARPTAQSSKRSTNDTSDMLNDRKGTFDLGSSSGSNSLGLNYTYFGIWRKVMQLPEITEQWFNLKMTPGCELFSFPSHSITKDLQNDLIGLPTGIDYVDPEKRWWRPNQIRKQDIVHVPAAAGGSGDSMPYLLKRRQRNFQPFMVR
jgi:hypothetical protein